MCAFANSNSARCVFHSQARRVTLWRGPAPFCILCFGFATRLAFTFFALEKSMRLRLLFGHYNRQMSNKTRKNSSKVHKSAENAQNPVQLLPSGWFQRRAIAARVN
jgi:hypothetical protein